MEDADPAAGCTAEEQVDLEDINLPETPVWSREAGEGDRWSS
jgi:hypothetical protein